LDTFLPPNIVQRFYRFFYVRYPVQLEVLSLDFVSGKLLLECRP